MISRPSGLRWLDPFEAELGEIEPIDERVDRPNWIILVDPVFQDIPETACSGRDLLPRRSASSDLPANRDGIVPHESRQVGRFHTAWVINGGRVMSAIGQFIRNKQTLVGAACRSLRCQKKT